MTTPETPPKSHPTARLFGILHVVLASVGLLAVLFSLLIVPLVPQITGKPVPNPLRDQLGLRGYAAWMAVTAILGLGWKTLMLVSGVWLLKGLDKGRKLGNAWAVGSILIGTVFALLTTFWIMPMTWDAQQQADVHPNLGPGFYQTMKWVMGGFQLVVGLACAWVYQMFALVKLNKPAVKATLR